VLDAQLALIILHAVEADVGAATVSVHNGKAVALGLPRKGQHLLSLVGQLKDLRGARGGGGEVQEAEDRSEGTGVEME
jgi:hypothetical protein